jgi:hypothetical protein
MKDDSLSDVQPFMMIDNFNKMADQNEFLKGKTISVLEKEIWNEAIDAALIANDKIGGTTDADVAIRKLKK